METPSSSRRQALRQGADSNQVQLRKETSLSKYYSIAKRLLDHFTAAFDDRSLDEAYIYGVRFVSLCVQSIPQHPSYKHRSYAIQHKEMSDKCNHVLECLEIVRQRMDAQEILREQQRQLEQKQQQLEIQRADEAEKEARRQQEKVDSEDQDATKTQISALSKLSALQRDLNQPTANNVDAVQAKKIQKTEPAKESQSMTIGLIRARVDFVAESDASPIEVPETTEETPENSAAAAPSLLDSAMSRMASMVSRKPKSKEPTDEVSNSTTTNKKLLRAHIMDAPVTSSKTPQSAKPVKKEVKKQQPTAGKTQKPNAVPETKKASEKQVSSSKEENEPLQVANLVAKPKPQQPTVEQSKQPRAVPKTKKISEKQAVGSSSNKTKAPLQVAELVGKPKSKPSKQMSIEKERAPISQKKEVKAAVKRNGVTPTQTKGPAYQPATVEQNSKSTPGEPPKAEPSIAEAPNETPDCTQPVQHQERRPEQDTIDLLEASIQAQVQRIEEIEEKLIPKLLEQARIEHQTAKNPKMPKQERMLHKRKAVHCLSQKRKWAKLAETTKIAVFHMETQIFRLEHVMEEQQVEQAMNEAKSVIQTMGNSVGVSDLEGFSEAVGAGDLVKTATVDGEEDEILMEELESWIGFSASDGSHNNNDINNNKGEETLDEDDLSILSLPNMPYQDLPSPTSLHSNKLKDKISKKLVPAAM